MKIVQLRKPQPNNKLITKTQLLVTINVILQINLKLYMPMPMVFKINLNAFIRIGLDWIHDTKSNCNFVFDGMNTLVSAVFIYST